MKQMDREYFEHLKRMIAIKLSRKYPGTPEDLSEWKGQVIRNFQLDLLEEVHDQVSEKWFYIHMKSRGKRLPRIDMLNLLSKYAGYKDWDDFRKQSLEIKSLNLPVRSLNERLIWLTPILVIAITITLYALYMNYATIQYELCFLGRDLEMPVKDNPLTVTLLNEKKQSEPIYLNTDKCITLSTALIDLHCYVEAPYYKNDTLTVRLSGNSDSIPIYLETDDYALMLNYYLENNLEDWNERKRNLSELFAENARIVEVFGDGKMGLEIYSKQRFIDRLMVPVKSLSNIQILDIQYKNSQIVSMRFKSMAYDELY